MFCRFLPIIAISEIKWTMSQHAHSEHRYKHGHEHH